jgi:hypothetical protein
MPIAHAAAKSSCVVATDIDPFDILFETIFMAN